MTKPFTSVAIMMLVEEGRILLGDPVSKVFTAEEYSAKAKKEPFLRDVLSKPKIFLIGNEHDLAELARRKS